MPRSALTVIGFLLLIRIPSHVPLWAQSLTQRLRAESYEKLAKDARETGNAVRGAILFTQPGLHCTRCHVPAAAQPIGPDLKGLGNEVTDVYLVEALLAPSKTIKKGFESVAIVTAAGMTLTGRIVEERPDTIVLRLSTGDLQRITLPRSEIEEISPSKVSAMPDNLVDQLADRQQFLDLVRYVMELAAEPPSESARSHVVGQTIRPELQGIVLLKEFHCAACHKDDVTTTTLNEKQAPDLTRSINRIDPHYVQRFIASPLTVKPGTTMPDLMASLKEDERQRAAEEITHYLVSLNDQPFSARPIDREAGIRGRELFHTIGCVACHSPRDDDHRELLSPSSVPLGPVGDKYSLEGLTAFLEDPLATRPSGRMPKMQLTHWEAIDVASYLLSPRDETLSEEPFEPNPTLAARGKTRFAQLGCRQCHRLESEEAPATSVPLSRVRPERGCLSGSTGNWPTFSLSDDQRRAIQSALVRESPPLSSRDHIALTLAAFRCFNCHGRDELGGVPDERDVYFQTTNPNLGPQGRIPPTLTGVGAKLKPDWLRQVLLSGRTSRPYMLTRMPQYGTENIAHLVERFQQTDHLPPVEFPRFTDQKQMREMGAEMVGTGGLNCIACHTFRLQQAANMPAIDLTEMAERLKKEWFYHYMRDPQHFNPNTIMPSFWPGGRAMRPDILNGDPDLQIEALWQYLLDGRQARAPRGLIVEPIELLAGDQAVMLRRSYPEVGKRGIGVGYPSRVNLVFDAEQMRLALLWQGKFADPSGVWRGQGHGRVRPLGEKLISFAPGPDLDDAVSPWIVDDGRPPHHQFKGYSLDDKMRPRFRYEFAGIRVEDYVVDLVDPSTGHPFLRRTITLIADTDRGGLSFRVATGKNVVAKRDGTYVVDDRLRIHIDTEHSGTIVDTPEGAALRVPLSVSQAPTRLTVEYRW